MNWTVEQPNRLDARRSCDSSTTMVARYRLPKQRECERTQVVADSDPMAILCGF